MGSKISSSLHDHFVKHARELGKYLTTSRGIAQNSNKFIEQRLKMFVRLHFSRFLLLEGAWKWEVIAHSFHFKVVFITIVSEIQSILTKTMIARTGFVAVMLMCSLAVNF